MYCRSRFRVILTYLAFLTAWEPSLAQSAVLEREAVLILKEDFGKTNLVAMVRRDSRTQTPDIVAIKTADLSVDLLAAAIQELRRLSRQRQGPVREVTTFGLTASYSRGHTREFPREVLERVVSSILAAPVQVVPGIGRARTLALPSDLIK